MTATVVALSPVITVEAPRLPADARRGELRRLAAEVLETSRPSAYVLRVALRALVHPSIPDDKVPEYWGDLLDALRLADDVDSGFTTWRSVFPELCNGGDEGEARDITRQGAEAALCVLVNGEGRVIR